MISTTNATHRMKDEFIPKFAAHQIHIDLICHSVNPLLQSSLADMTPQIRSRLAQHPVPFFDVLAPHQMSYEERHALLYDLLQYGPKKGLLHFIQEQHGLELTHRIREISHPDGNSAHFRVLFALDVSIEETDLQLAVSNEYKAKLQHYGIDSDFVQISHLELDQLPWSVASTMNFVCRGV